MQRPRTAQWLERKFFGVIINALTKIREKKWLLKQMTHYYNRLLSIIRQPGNPMNNLEPKLDDHDDILFQNSDMRSVTIESFGETRDERRVVLIRMTNVCMIRNPNIGYLGNAMRLEMLNLGATVRSIVVPDREGVMTDVALGFDAVKAYENDHLFVGSTLGRVAGRIRGARCAIESKEYFLAQNDHPHHRNGGAKNPLSKKVWDYTLLDDGSGVVFSVKSHDGEEGYPGNVTVQVSYVLTNHNEILVQYSANTDKSTILSNKSGIDLNVSSTQSCVRLSTGLELSGMIGKQGKPYRSNSAFVLGCQGYEDACNQVRRED
uniref:Galactose mutarotase n=1 Tax=Angiostrongylus cantonensis TaxID=6313 RepID=A0A158PBQ4_ANGCA